MLFPAKLTEIFSARRRLATYVTHVHWHIFPAILENVTTSYFTFGGVEAK